MYNPNKIRNRWHRFKKPSFDGLDMCYDCHPREFYIKHSFPTVGLGRNDGEVVKLWHSVEVWKKAVLDWNCSVHHESTVGFIDIIKHGSRYKIKTFPRQLFSYILRKSETFSNERILPNCNFLTALIFIYLSVLIIPLSLVA